MAHAFPLFTVLLLAAACSPPAPAERAERPERMAGQTAGEAAAAGADAGTSGELAAQDPAQALRQEEAERCLNIARIQEARPVSDDRIDFVMRGGEVYRNDLQPSCPGLGFERAFTYSTSLSRLCAGEIIQVVQQTGGPTLGASCGLGEFVKIAADASGTE